MQFYKMTKIVAVSALEMNENPFNINIRKEDFSHAGRSASVK